MSFISVMTAPLRYWVRTVKHQSRGLPNGVRVSYSARTSLFTFHSEDLKECKSLVLYCAQFELNIIALS